MIHQTFTLCQRATPRQQEVLYRILHPSEWRKITALSKEEASREIARHVASVDRAMIKPTERQERFLRARGYWDDGLTRDRATAVIGEIMRHEEER